VSRFAQLAVTLALLVATAAAFAVAERLKLERSPITATRVDKVFSPVCECPRDYALVSFVLRRPETVTLKIVDPEGESVRTVVRKRDEAKGRVSYTWDGRDDDDRIVVEGIYRPRVELERHGRTIVMPSRIRVDTTQPRIVLTGVRPRVFSPDGDGYGDRVTVRFRVDERSRPVLLVDGDARVRGKLRRSAGKLVWFGSVDGRVARPGTYELRLRTADEAGNQSHRTRAVAVRVRFVEISRDSVEVGASRRFSVRVDADAPSYRWRFAGRTGTSSRPVLVLRAPETPGAYALYVSVGRRADRARVIVSESTPSP
jgi:hypothetical protein